MTFKITFDAKTYKLAAVKTLYICAFSPNHAHRLITHYGMTFTSIEFSKRIRLDPTKLKDIGIYEKNQDGFKRVYPKEK